MAESADQLYKRIVASLQGQPALSGRLTPIAGDSLARLAQDIETDSDVAFWRIIAATIAQVDRDAISIPFDEVLAEAEELARTAEYGSDAWLAAYLKGFQLGDVVGVLPDNTIGYSIPDLDKQIVKFVAVTSKFGEAIIKVAKADGNGDPQELTLSELTSVRFYLDAIYAPGTSWKVSSLPPDMIALRQAKVWYDGERGRALFQPELEAALQAFCRQSAFNGIFKTNGWPALPGLQDYLRANVVGFHSIGITEIAGKPGLTPTAPWVPFNHRYVPASGFTRFSLADSTITYASE